MPSNFFDVPGQSLNILFIAAEADPFVKMGGLGDVAGSLPKAMAELVVPGSSEQRIDIRLAIPYYEQIKQQNIATCLVTSFNVDSLDGPIQADIYSTDVTGITTYLVSGEPISRNAAVYGTDFKSDAEKFIFFSLACLALPQNIGWKTHIFHANDWHTAVAVHALKLQSPGNIELKSTHTILTVHNLPFMGSGSEEGLRKFKVPFSTNKNLPEWGKSLPLPMGLASADRIVAVSPTYAQEILTPEYGCDLQQFLRTRKRCLSGILNGLDIESWNPETDSHIAAKFNKLQLEKKILNKTALQKEFGLEQNPDIPLLTLISRMDTQKGIDIALEGLRRVRNLPWQAVLLGTGNQQLENACIALSNELPDKVHAAIRFDSKLSHLIYAGADILLMPSRYEPCGLSQMIAMRYGCIPVARATGGLVDTIVDASSGEIATGFLFSTAEPVSFSRALQFALEVFKDKESWQQMMRMAMDQDFSWSRSAAEYLQLYLSIIK